MYWLVRHLPSYVSLKRINDLGPSCCRGLLPYVITRVLDFCCGSGVIAAALLKREPTVKVDALDADSLAVAAAKVNLPAASKVLCSDCWRGLEEEEDEAVAEDDSTEASKQVTV